MAGSAPNACFHLPMGHKQGAPPFGAVIAMTFPDASLSGAYQPVNF